LPVSFLVQIIYRIVSYFSAFCSKLLLFYSKHTTTTSLDFLLKRLPNTVLVTVHPVIKQICDKDVIDSI